MININYNEIKRIEKLLPELETKAPTVIYRALNRAVSKVRTVMSRETKARYNIKSREVRNTILLEKAHRNSLEAQAISRGPHISLDNFLYKPKKPRPKKPPVLKVAVKKDGDYKNIKNAFVADINGNNNYFIFKRMNRKRLPIKKILGPAIPQMIDNPDIENFIQKEAVKTYEKRLDHNIKRELEKYK